MIENAGVGPALQVVITQDMVPRTRVIVYYITAARDVVADSLSVDVEESCRGEVSLVMFWIQNNIFGLIVGTAI